MFDFFARSKGVEQRSQPRGLHEAPSLSPLKVGHKAESMSSTSCVSIISATHCRQRQLERKISTADLQRAIKYGTKEKVWRWVYGKQRFRWKLTYNGIVFITEADMKTQVTAWTTQKSILPLSIAPLSKEQKRQCREQKRRLRIGATAITSHTVVVVDQSGSMKNVDMLGHSNRSRGAFYTISQEMVATPLLHGLLGYSDVMSVIDMRDGGAYVMPELDKEPITWELHNKLVHLASDDKRAYGDGNYTSALEAAGALLEKSDNGTCALFLLFLSDGGPSDRNITGENHLHMKFARIAAKSTEVCSMFGSRLTFGTFGFAHDKGSSFDLLKQMASEAASVGASASFASGLDTVAVRRGLKLMTTSLIRTRTSLSSLDGGSVLRPGPRRGPARTDLVRDEYEKDIIADDLLFDPIDYEFYMQGNPSHLQRYEVERATVHAEDNFGDIRFQERFQETKMMHPDACGIAFKKRYMGIGAERACYWLTEVDIDRNPIGQPLVGKVPSHHQESDHIFTVHSANTQVQALRLAKTFNKRLSEGDIKVPHIDFLAPHYYECWEGMGMARYILAEKRLDNTQYRKFNDNKGGVNALNKPAAGAEIGEGLALKDAAIDVIEEESEDDDCYASDEERPKQPATKEEKSRIIDEDVPQAFSHWTFTYTQGNYLVCDLQGVLGTSFHLTDPAIHSWTSRSTHFGDTDRGREGMKAFFRTHVCNPLCKALRLKEGMRVRRGDTWRVVSLE